MVYYTVFLFSLPFSYHLLFSLTGGGKYNYMGTKKWVEENMDHAGVFSLKTSCLSVFVYAYLYRHKALDHCCYILNISIPCHVLYN